MKIPKKKLFLAPFSPPVSRAEGLSPISPWLLMFLKKR